MVALCLGTAQFGLSYGVSNAAGQVPQEEVGQILHRTRELGVTILDTAPAYGTSESVLGALDAASQFDIISKTPQFRTDEITRAQADEIRQQFEASLKALGASALHGLMLHWPGDLLAPGADHIWDVLSDLKAQGLVEALGVSVYTPEELMTIMERYPCDITQVPLNVLDQRFVKTGALRDMKEKGGTVYARSAFLQGLLFMGEATIPDHLAAARVPVAKLQEAATKNEMSVLEASLGFMAAQEDVDYVVCGVTSLKELDEIAVALSRPAIDGIDYSEFSVDETAIIDPRLWQAKA